MFSPVEMNAVFGDNKPNCLILDEIDGALGGSGDGKAEGKARHTARCSDFVIVLS